MRNRLTEIYSINSERVVLDTEDEEGGVYLRAIDGSRTVEVFLDSAAKQQLIDALNGVEE